MTDIPDLIRRLRTTGRVPTADALERLCREAADALEALTAERDQAREIARQLRDGGSYDVHVPAFDWDRYQFPWEEKS